MHRARDVPLRFKQAVSLLAGHINSACELITMAPVINPTPIGFTLDTMLANFKVQL